MSVNKVTVFGENLIDLTEDTVTKETIIKGVTAHDASGNSVTGTFDTDKYLEKTGDASNTTAAFSASEERANISTGEKMSVIFGKIAKFFSDLKTVAFTGKYSDLSGTPSVVSETADGLCPKNGGTTTKFLRDDGTYAVPTSSVSGLSTIEQVTAAATAGNVTAPVGAGALAEVNSSLVSDIYVGDDGYLHKVKDGADSVLPFKNIKSGSFKIDHYGSYAINLGLKPQFLAFVSDTTYKVTVYYDKSLGHVYSGYDSDLGWLTITDSGFVWNQISNWGLGTGYYMYY